ncbi:UPF0481 protein At3g47200-like [Syzygium oleosum]|uniref:UPF0481 protein At3g47200-like n=1 Tax=Syzygium oleosum TaxID=219896 RepID=UPI0024BBA1CC|nr:UPF0481 protein At3g47200-like [Syzygium oleosum]
MDRAPLLSIRTETCGTYETPSPPSPDPNETNQIVPANNSMPSIEQQNWKDPSIYKVPAHITILRPEAYQPQVVSFGPYHHDKDQLRPMDKHKRRALQQFLDRSKKSDKPFFESLRKVEHELKDSYDELDRKWKECTGDQFLELMIMDGCFMLEIMRTTIEEKHTIGEKHGYAPNDPVFSIDRLKYRRSFITRDMLILENQLPMLVLYELVAIESDNKKDQEDVNRLILKYCSATEKKYCSATEKKYCSGRPIGKCLHVLDVFRKGQLMMTTKKVQHDLENVGLQATEEIIRSANELHKAGIQFKTSPTGSLEDISFTGGVLRLPVIKVGDHTESMFLNLMTFERLHIGAGNAITAYVTFMDNIINSEQDVALLHAEGIIQNALGSDKAVAKLFNSLCEGVPLASNSSLDAVQENIGMHCETRWNKWKAHLNRDYFGSPWAILSLIAAIFLFILTIIQTVYAVLG